MTLIKSGNSVIIIKWFIFINNLGGTAGNYNLVPFLYLELGWDFLFLKNIILGILKNNKSMMPSIDKIKGRSNIYDKY